MAFKVQVLGEGDDARVELIDTSNNTLVEVYAFGGLLNRFLFEYPGGTLNAIDGFESPEEARRDLTPMFKSAKLSPFVCRTNKGEYRFGEKDYHLNKYYTNGNAIHGLIYNSVFNVVEATDTNNSATVKLALNYSDEKEGFPFEYKCEVRYTLQENNSLVISTSINNLGDKLMPVADGWHPYFTLGDTVDNCQLEFQSKEILDFDEALIPTGKLLPYQEFGSLKNLGDTSFDNCFTVNFAECQPMCVFRNPKQKIQVEIYPEKSYPYLQIFTPGHRRSIAIENLSAAPDAFNNGMGLHVLVPGESISFQTKFVLKSYK